MNAKEIITGIFLTGGKRYHRDCISLQKRI